MNDMKKLLLLFAAFLMVSCGASMKSDCDTHPDGYYRVLVYPDSILPLASQTINGVVNTVRVVEIDSCEYLVGRDMITHKGNCKYCEERRKRTANAER